MEVTRVTDGVLAHVPLPTLGLPPLPPSSRMQNPHVPISSISQTRRKSEQVLFTAIGMFVVS